MVVRHKGKWQWGTKETMNSRVVYDRTVEAKEKSEIQMIKYR